MHFTRRFTTASVRYLQIEFAILIAILLIFCFDTSSAIPVGLLSYPFYDLGIQ